MAKIERTTDDLACVLRGIALAMGLLVNIPFLHFLISSGGRVYPKLLWNDAQGVPLFLALTLALLGYLTAWRWKEIGGAMAMVSAVAISALVYLGSGRALLPAALMISVPLFFAGMLFLACRRRAGQLHIIANGKDATGGHPSKLMQAQGSVRK